MTAIQPQTVVRQMLVPRQLAASQESGGAATGSGAAARSPFVQTTNPTQQPLHYMLQWHDHHASFFRLLEELCQSQSLTDVSLICGDVSIEAHSVVLSASSPILRSMLAKSDGKKQSIFFVDLSPYHLQLLLQYMYRGEVSIPQADLNPVMQIANKLQIHGLCNSNSDQKLREYASFLAQPQFQQPQPQSTPRQQQQPLQTPTLISMASETVEAMHLPLSEPVIRMTPHIVNGTRNSEKLNEPFDMTPKFDFENGSPESINNMETKLMVKPRKKQLKRKLEISNGSDDGHTLRTETAELIGVNGEIGTVMEIDIPAVNGESSAPSSVLENWSDQPTMKVRGHKIPVLPKPLSQMKTTETRSYLSRLIWATNGWKRPQYGNPETRPVWWPDVLLKWPEMKKMGGKKSVGLSNVNFNEIQKTILTEGYKYFGFDPETLCYIGTKEEKEKLLEDNVGNNLLQIVPEPLVSEEKHEISLPEVLP